MPASDFTHSMQRALCGQHPKCHICCGLIESPSHAEAPFYSLGYCRLSTGGRCRRCRRLPDDDEVWTGWAEEAVAGPLGVQHPGGGLWTNVHLLTWGEAADAHASLTGLSGSGLDTPGSEAISDYDADLERHRAAAVLRAAPGALCNECWALSCRECGEEMDEAAVDEAALDEQGRGCCARCRHLEAGFP